MVNLSNQEPDSVDSKNVRAANSTPDLPITRLKSPKTSPILKTMLIHQTTKNTLTQLKLDF